MMSASDPAPGNWWERGATVDPPHLALVERTWRHFAEHHCWPLHWTLRREYERAGQNVDALLDDYHVAAMTRDETPRVVPSLPALLHLADVRSLLEPIAAVLRVSCERFLANPMEEDPRRRPSLAFSEVRSRWGDRAELALAFMRDRDPPLTWRRWTPNEAWHEPDFRILRFARVVSLADVFAAVRSRDFVRVSSPLVEPQLGVVRAIFEYARAHGDWPLAVPFAIAHNAKTYLPDVMNELDQAGFGSGFNNSRLARLTLTSRAVGDLGMGESAARLIRGCYEEFLDLENDAPVQMSAIAERAGLPLADAAALFLVLDHATWFTLRDREADRAARTVHLRDDVRKLRDVRTWDQYFAAIYPPRPEPLTPLRPFISYSRLDEALAAQLRRAYEAAGARPFHSSHHLQGIPAGATWFEAILEGLRGASGVVFLATSTAVTELWPLLEMGAALGRPVPAIPLLIGIPPERLPGPLVSVQARFIDRGDEAVLHALAQAAGGEVGMWTGEGAAREVAEFLRLARESAAPSGS